MESQVRKSAKKEINRVLQEKIMGLGVKGMGIYLNRLVREDL